MPAKSVCFQCDRPTDADLGNLGIFLLVLHLIPVWDEIKCSQFRLILLFFSEGCNEAEAEKQREAFFSGPRSVSFFLSPAKLTQHHFPIAPPPIQSPVAIYSLVGYSSAAAVVIVPSSSFPFT